MKISILLFIALSISPARAATSFHELQRFPIGGDGGWDLLTIDSAANRVYIARSDRILALDEDSGRLIGEVSGLNGSHGVALDSKSSHGFATSGKTNEVFVFDTKTLKTVSKIKVGENPDVILFDSVSNSVLAFNGKSHDVSVIDAAGLKVVSLIKLEGKPELAVSDENGHVYVNLEDKSELAVLDIRQRKVLSTHKLAPCEEPTGLALATKTRRLIVGCGNKISVIVDADSGKVLQSFKTGGGVDGAAFDSNHDLAFISAGEGVLTILSENSKGFHLVQDLPTIKGARTLAVDSRSGKVFLPTAKFGAPPAASETGHNRPAIIPGSFFVLVVGKN